MSSPATDLTARARIRDAAIALFAERGIAAATIRDIAQAAGVSSGLLRHHFGSKEGLRDACDEYAMGRLTQVGAQFLETQTTDAFRPEIMRMQRYLVRSTMDGSPTGNALFERMVAYGEQWLATTGFEVSDARAYAAVLSAMKIGTLILRDQLSLALGEDVTRPAGHLRVLKASIEIFSHALLTPDQAEAAQKALERLFQDPEEGTP